MEPQQEIGKTIREKVDSGQYTLDAPVWDSIKESLVKERKRKAFYNWSLNALIILATVGGFYVLTTTFNPINKEDHLDSSYSKAIEETTYSDKNSPKVITSLSEDSTLKLEKKKISTMTQDKNSTESLGYVKEKNDASFTTVSNDTRDEKKLYPSKQEEQGIERTIKVYHYYSHKTGQEMMSTDKKVIDSVIKANTIKSDSLR